MSDIKPIGILMRKPTVLLLLLLATSLAATAQNLKLWYKAPAAKWTDALPIGNGTLGAMLFAGVDTDHIQFNEQTLWTQGPHNYQHPGAAQSLPAIQTLLFEGKQAEAQALAEKNFMGAKYNSDNYAAQYAVWFKKIRADITAASPNFDEHALPQMKVPTLNGWESAGLPGLDGVVWFRNTFALPASWKGKALVIDLGKVRDEDFTYINGHLIGSTDGMNISRHYRIDPALLTDGLNHIAIQIINPDDKGGLTGGKNGQIPYMVYPEGDDPKNGIALAPNWKYYIQDKMPPAFPHYQASYQPFADLYLGFGKQASVTDYKRELDISNSISTTSYTVNGVHFTREYFASAPANLIVIRIKADRPGQISFNARMNSAHPLSSTHKIDDHTLGLSLQVLNGALNGQSYVRAEADKGTVTVTDSTLNIQNADAATIYLSAATNFISYNNVQGDAAGVCKAALKAVEGKAYTEVKGQAIADYQHYFNTFSVDLGKGVNDALPTDERIRKFSVDADPSLLTLYMQYARYLLLASSRPDSKLPANLQGIWNDQLVPPWGSKFTTNINLEMNYWSAEELNLSACSQPLFKLIAQASVPGSLTAKVHYNAPGWVLHHNTDIWLGTAPIDAADHGVWVDGAAWLCHHIWEHYLYTRDVAFLAQYYPVMRQAAEFFVATLIKDPTTGLLISSPGSSPEHGGMVAGPTMDHQIIRDLFKNCIAAAKVLNTDAAFSNTLQTKYAQIAPNKIGKYGQLQEWLEDKDDTTDTHRHVSHLWGVYPGTDITWDNSPAMMKAAERSFYFRGDEGTGWSLAWKVNLMARFKHADHAMKLVANLLRDADNTTAKEKAGVYHNLFDAHPPFQIDGNFGGAAGIAEMLLQSQQGYLDILPALPAALPNGELKGICARGGFVLDISWKNGKLYTLTVRSTSNNACELRYGTTIYTFKALKGGVYHFNAQLKPQA